MKMQISYLKLDRDAFAFVLGVLGRAPQRVLFLDDNRLNIDGARSMGMHARRTAGPDQVREALREFDRRPAAA